MIVPNLNRIPKELKEFDQWNVWKAESQNKQKKSKKTPYDAESGKQGSVTDLETWCDFKTAKSAYENGE